MLKHFLRCQYVQILTPDEEPYNVDDNIYSRFDQKNNLTVGRPNWDDQIKSVTGRVANTRIKYIKNHKANFQLKDYSLFFSAGAVASRLGTSINQSNRGLTAWTPLGKAAEEDMVAPDLPEDLSIFHTDPSAASLLIKKVARFFGADLVGIAPLDKRWIFSHAYWNDGSHKEIVFKDIQTPMETETELIIPTKMKWVIVMGIHMDSETLSFTPLPVGCAETQRIYSQMAMLVCVMAEYLRNLGYSAIPSMNDLGTNIPMAIDAGIGEQGRNGKLITPEFGPSVRLCKVITDLPMDRDYPIRFGVKEFCKVCKKCAANCPAKAIPEGEPAWSGSTVSNTKGVLKWHLNNEACRKYWSLGPGTNCAICIRSCPFTKNQRLIHDLVRLGIAKLPALNSGFVKLDNYLGYGEFNNEMDFWSEP